MTLTPVLRVLTLVATFVLATFAASNVELPEARRVQELEKEVAELRQRLHLQDAQASLAAVSGTALAQLWPPARQLADSHDEHASSNSADEHGSTNSTDEHGASSGHEEHVGHQHDALLYLILALIIGTAILHLTTLPIFHSLPYTVVLFVLGCASALVYRWMGHTAQEKLGVFGRSYEMWMDIDPHTLIFTMLPVLLTGDAMTIDTSVAKRVAMQCLWLAGPGVLLSAIATAGFLYVYLGWDFLLCMAVGSILAATDPVAVVGLLKELGASPTLTVQIQGESLLNDGTAMVLFLVTYAMLEGEEHNAKSIIVFLVYMVLGSWFLGAVIGAVFSSWIRAAGNRLEHHSSMIQISLTLCCGYFSFVFAEGVIGISGVLSTVAAALILADTIWPKIVSKEAMHEVWHTLEYLGNTVIFFLAGALTGEVMVLVDAIDYLHLLVIYLVAVIIRGGVLFASLPVLKWLSPDKQPVTWQEAVIMTWGGLRGAVGLALAITVKKDRAGGRLSEELATRVLFFTGGIAFLTLVVNATTCPTLVKKLGITATGRAKGRVMMQVQRRLCDLGKQNTGPVVNIIDKLLDEIKQHIHHDCPDVDSHSQDDAHSRTSDEIVAEYNAAKRLFIEVSSEHKTILGWDDSKALSVQETGLLSVVKLPADPDMMQTVNQCFLGMVRHEHWGQIERGEFVKGSDAGDFSLSSNTKAMQRSAWGLHDLKWLLKFYRIDEDKALEEIQNSGMFVQKTFTSQSLVPSIKHARCVDFCRDVTTSVIFQGFIVAVILINSVLIFTDPGPESPDAVAYVIVDCVFQAIYMTELIMKLVVLRLAYFSDGWNALDFSCVVLGLFGNAVSVAVVVHAVSSSAISNEMLLIRLGRVFKLLRLLRVVVVVKFVRTLHARYHKKKVSDQLAFDLQVMSTLRTFVQAHIRSHVVFLKFFGKQQADPFNTAATEVLTPFSRQVSDSISKTIAESGLTNVLDEPEEARCILDSLISIYKAVAIGSVIMDRVNEEGTWILESMNTLRDSYGIVEELMNFTVLAINAGVLKEKDAEVLIHPLRHHLDYAGALVSDTYAGIHQTKLKRYSTTVWAEEDETGSQGEGSPGLDTIGEHVEAIDV